MHFDFLQISLSSYACRAKGQCVGAHAMENVIGTGVLVSRLSPRSWCAQSGSQGQFAGARPADLHGHLADYCSGLDQLVQRTVDALEFVVHPARVAALDIAEPAPCDPGFHANE